MEKDVKIGNVGDLDLSISGGKALVKVSVGAESAAAGLAVKAELSASLDAGALVDKLFAAIEAASPAGAVPIEEGVKAIVKAAVLAV